MPEIRTQMPSPAADEEPTKLKILLADDHAVMRESLKNILEQRGFDVVGEAADGREAVTLAIQLHPDVVVLDVGMPLLNGIEAANELRQRLPHTKIILLTMYDEESYVRAAREAGVDGYVLKTEAASDLIKAIQNVIQGKLYVSPGISAAWHGAFARQQDFVSLTARERVVLRHVSEGKSNKQIAHLLNINQRTVESHRSRIMRKLQTHNTAGLVRYAIRSKLISG